MAAILSQPQCDKYSSLVIIPTPSLAENWNLEDASNLIYPNKMHYTDRLERETAVTPLQ